MLKKLISFESEINEDHAATRKILKNSNFSSKFFKSHENSSAASNSIKGILSEKDTEILFKKNSEFFVSEEDPEISIDLESQDEPSVQEKLKLSWNPDVSKDQIEDYFEFEGLLEQNDSKIPKKIEFLQKSSKNVDIEAKSSSAREFQEPEFVDEIETEEIFEETSKSLNLSDEEEEKKDHDVENEVEEKQENENVFLIKHSFINYSQPPEFDFTFKNQKNPLTKKKSTLRFLIFFSFNFFKKIPFSSFEQFEKRS